MGEVGVHLEYVEIVRTLQRPFESGYVGSAESLFSGALHQMYAAGTFLLFLSHDIGGAVGRAVVDHEHIKRVRQIHHRVDYSGDILFLIIGGDNYHAVALTGGLRWRGIWVHGVGGMGDQKL